MKTAFVATLVALPVLGLSSSTLTDLPPWKLTATRDSFVINVNGQSMGSAVVSVVPLPTGFRVTESTRIGTMVEQTTEVLLDLEQRIVSVKQSGKMRGQEARIDLQYGGKRVKGTAMIPGPDGPKSYVIDSAVPEDVADDNLVQTLIGRLPWNAESQYVLPVFSAGKNALMQMKLIVLGTEDVALPNGSVAAYKVEVSGEGNHVVHFYISKAVPQRILKIAPVDAPFEMIRAN